MTDVVSVVPSQGRLCPECGEPFDTPLRLGAHRRSKHDVIGATNQASKGPKTRQRRRGRPPGESRPVIDAIKEFADEAGAGRGSGPPTEDNLTRAFARSFAAVTMAGALYVVEDDPRLATDEQKEEAADHLMLSARGAHDIAEPFGRAFHRSPLNKRYGRALVDNVDLVGAVAELSIMALRWRRYMADRRRWEAAVAAGALPAQAIASPAAPVFEEAAPMSPYTPAAPPNGGVRMDEREGIVWTPQMVEDMRARSQGS